MQVNHSLGVATLVAQMAAHRRPAARLLFDVAEAARIDVWLQADMLPATPAALHRFATRRLVPHQHHGNGDRTMDALECLLGRNSAPVLTAPGPNQAELDTMLQAAVRAPDHGRLRPWRFVIIPEDKRSHFGDVLASSLRRREPDAAPEALQRERNKAMRAPVIVVVAAHVERTHKIPVVEQLAATAAAAANILLAAYALGYGAVWKTGAPAYDPGVVQSLGLNGEDEIVGFLYLGTAAAGAAPMDRPPASEFTSVWTG